VASPLLGSKCATSCFDSCYQVWCFASVLVTIPRSSAVIIYLLLPFVHSPLVHFVDLLPEAEGLHHLSGHYYYLANGLLSLAGHRALTLSLMTFPDAHHAHDLLLHWTVVAPHTLP
jgi:hypothetical protein